MDDIQKKLVTMIKEQPSCINDRKQLRAILLDYLPQNKLQQNLILNAYDEDIVERLKPSSDVTLHALQMVKILSDGYGLTKDAAMWSVISWCQMLKLGEVADVLDNMATTSSPSTPNQPQPQPMPVPKTTTKLGCGRFCAGVDFPAGDIKIESLAPKGTNVIYSVLKKTKSAYSDVENGSFKTQTYLTVAAGNFLEIDEDVKITLL